MSVQDEWYKPVSVAKGRYALEIDFQEVLMPGNYSLGLGLFYFNTGAAIDFVESFYPFTVLKESKTHNMEYPWATVHGYVKPKTTWRIKQL
jgi:hypothetical protein